jgi:hypothetical protein
MHLYNCIWVILLISRLNLAFLSPKLSHGIDKVLIYLCPCGFDNPRNTLRWKLLQLTSVCLQIILFGLRTANKCLTNERCEEVWGEMKVSALLHRAIPHPQEMWDRSLQTWPAAILSWSSRRLPHIAIEEMLEGTRGCCVAWSDTARCWLVAPQTPNKSLGLEGSCHEA